MAAGRTDSAGCSNLLVVVAASEIATGMMWPSFASHRQQQQQQQAMTTSTSDSDGLRRVGNSQSLDETVQPAAVDTAAETGKTVAMTTTRHDPDDDDDDDDKKLIIDWPANHCSVSEEETTH